MEALLTYENLVKEVGELEIEFRHLPTLAAILLFYETEESRNHLVKNSNQNSNKTINLQSINYIFLKFFFLSSLDLGLENSRYFRTDDLSSR